MGLNSLILKNETFFVNFKLSASATTILVVRMEWQKVENSASQIPMTWDESGRNISALPRHWILSWWKLSCSPLS